GRYFIDFRPVRSNCIDIALIISGDSGYLLSCRDIAEGRYLTCTSQAEIQPIRQYFSGEGGRERFITRGHDAVFVRLTVRYGQYRCGGKQRSGATIHGTACYPIGTGACEGKV